MPLVSKVDVNKLHDFPPIKVQSTWKDKWQLTNATFLFTVLAIRKRFGTITDLTPRWCRCLSMSVFVYQLNIAMMRRHPIKHDHKVFAMVTWVTDNLESIVILKFITIYIHTNLYENTWRLRVRFIFFFFLYSIKYSQQHQPQVGSSYNQMV